MANVVRGLRRDVGIAGPGERRVQIHHALFAQLHHGIGEDRLGVGAGRENGFAVDRLFRDGVLHPECPLPEELSVVDQQGSLQGQIGSHQGAIGSLQGARWSASDDLRRRIDREIQQHEAAIRKLEAEKDDGALSRRLAEAEAELRAFQQSSRGQIAELERQIRAIRSENKIGELEKEIDSLHAEERIDEIKRRVAPALDRLKALIRKLGS